MSKLAGFLSLPNNQGEIVSLRINGVDAGSYVLLERYDKVLMEKQNEVHSSIFKIDEAAFITLDKKKNHRLFEYNFSQHINYSAAMWKNRTKDSGSTEEHRALLHHVFEILTRNEILNDSDYSRLEYFINMDDYAWQSAFNFLFGAHLDAPHNALIYYDTVTGQFRPLLVDPDFQRLKYENIDDGNTRLNFQIILNKLVTNKKFIKIRNEKLHYLISNKEKIFEIFDNVFENSKKYYIGDGLLPAKSIEFGGKLSSSMNGPLYYFIYYAYKSSLEERFNLISQYLDISNDTPSFPKQETYKYQHPLSSVLITHKKNHLLLSFRHNQEKPLYLKGMSFKQNSQNESLTDNITPSFVDNNLGHTYIPGLTDTENDSLTWSLNDISLKLEQNSEVQFKILSPLISSMRKFEFQIQDENGDYLPKNRIIERIADERFLLDIPEGGPNVLEVFFKNSNINVRLKGKKIVVESGEYNIFNSIIIPKGYQLIIPSATKFRFNQNTWFVSYSPVKVNGTEESPVIFQADIPSNNWNGFLVFQTNQQGSIRNTINHFILKDGKSGSFNGIPVTGALLFSESDVTIMNSLFVNAGLDDSLNVKRSDLIVENNVFLYAPSDAIDIDWGTGRVKQNYIYNAGGDGIDVSGSNELTITGNLISFNKDKGISVGERSNLKAEDNVMIGNYYGAVSKDISNFFLKGNVIIENNIGLAAYRKKSFFGGAEIISINNYLINNEKDLYTDSESSINHNINKLPKIKFKEMEPSSYESPLDILNWISNEVLPNNINMPVDLWKKQVGQN